MICTSTPIPDGFWSFNPFAWQMLFVFGAWCALGGTTQMSRLLSSPVTMWIAFAYLLAAFYVTLTWYYPPLGAVIPHWLEQWMYPIDKTDLDVLRFAHFLALAAITVRFVPAGWPGLNSPWLRPMILCGQHSLEIFALGVFLAFSGYFVLMETSAGLGVHILVGLLGIVIMSVGGVAADLVQAAALRRGGAGRSVRRFPAWRAGTAAICAKSANLAGAGSTVRLPLPRVVRYDAQRQAGNFLIF